MGEYRRGAHLQSSRAARDAVTAVAVTAPKLFLDDYPPTAHGSLFSAHSMCVTRTDECEPAGCDDWLHNSRTGHAVERAGGWWSRPCGWGNQTGPADGRESLKQVTAVITAKKIQLMPEEACDPARRTLTFFEQVQKELDVGIREIRPHDIQADIESGRIFIVDGQRAYVADRPTEARRRRNGRCAWLIGGRSTSSPSRWPTRRRARSGPCWPMTEPTSRTLSADRPNRG